MNRRLTGFILLISLAILVWSFRSRPLDLLRAPELSLAAYSQIEVLGDSGWCMLKDGDWRMSRPNRARLSNTQVEGWIRHFENLEFCAPPKEEPTRTLRFSNSDSSENLDVPVWFGVVGPAKVQLGGLWYSISSEFADPIRFGLSPFRTLQIIPPAIMPTGITITLGDRTSLELSKRSSWLLREPLAAPADGGAVQSWLEAVELKTASAILGVAPKNDEKLLSGLFPVSAELTLIDTDSLPTRSIRFGKRLTDGSRIAQVRGEDVVFVIAPEDTSFMLPSPTRFLIPTCTTLVPERIHTIAVGDQAVRRNALTGRFDSVGSRLLDLLTATPATNFAMADSLVEGAAFQAFDEGGDVLFTGQIQIEGAQLAIWSDGLARIMPLDEGLIKWLQSAFDTTDQDQSSRLSPERES